MARLRPGLGAYELYEYHARGGMTLVDLADRGNVDIRLPYRARPQILERRTQQWIAELEECGAEVVIQGDGSRSVRLNGIEFAKAGSWGLKYGLHVERPAEPADWPEALQLAQRLSRFRQAEPPDSLNPLYTASSEAWLECCVRRRPQALDPMLAVAPIYSQTPALAGLERGVMDLLAIGADGRLAIVELKTTESLRLPLQALDYWIRVEACRRQGLLEQRGYFPGHVLADSPVRALLAAPGLHFHPATETLLQFLPAEMEVERVGLASDWRRELSIVFRKRGPGRFA